VNTFDFRSLGGPKSQDQTYRIFKFEAPENGILSLSAFSCFKNLNFMANHKEPVFDKSTGPFGENKLIDQKFELDKGESVFLKAEIDDLSINEELKSPMLISNEF